MRKDRICFILIGIFLFIMSYLTYFIDIAMCSIFFFLGVQSLGLAILTYSIGEVDEEKD